MAAAGPPTARTRVRRHPERAAYEREQIDAILDAAWLCHVAVVEDGRPRVVPTVFGRWRDGLVLHGALANQLLASGLPTADRTAGAAPDTVDAAALSDMPGTSHHPPPPAPEVCVTVTVVDELVLARSAMHHSVNYRSVVAFGPLREITDPDDKRQALAAVVDHALPGRAGEARPPDDSELRATRVAAFSLSEASAKIRTGPPVDDPADAGLPVWSGTVPLRTVTGAPQAAPDRTPGVADPPSVVVRGAGPGGSRERPAQG